MRVACLFLLLAATLGLAGPALAQGNRQGGSARAVPAAPPRPPLQTEPGDIWAEVRGWHAARPRQGAVLPAQRRAATDSAEAGEPAAARRQPHPAAPAARPRRRPAAGQAAP
ncbi:hypothetical protein [Siccirubricoccus phaeus]|uniref:hypothetical protein n=1 Tax=Siccirubricoccus phaeus TaxID=2595053 RepID=UPI0011F32160|nr:hypothetical protein [Siccirubricoccus phaeus]